MRRRTWISLALGLSLAGCSVPGREHRKIAAPPPPPAVKVLLPFASAPGPGPESIPT